MFSGKLRLISSLIVVSHLGICFTAEGHSCVWKVTGPRGGVLYLGGSIHALRSTDYPLPAAYNRAFDLSDRIAFEAAPKALRDAGKGFQKEGQYRRGDTLKNHVDPRTYDYLRRFFGLLRVPEQEFSGCRPWLLALLLSAPQLHGLSPDLGVEGFLQRRAEANHKPISGLESAREGVETFSGLTERQSEAFLLLTFIPQEKAPGAQGTITNAWRSGDAETIARLTREEMSSFPALEARMLDFRNRKWLPEIEHHLRSGHIYFVVVGAAHLGGPNGLLSLLRNDGCRLEQL